MALTFVYDCLRYETLALVKRSLLSRRFRMQRLKDLIYSDGKVLGYTHGSDGVDLDFEDYCGTVFRIEFRGGVSIQDNGCVGYSVFKEVVTESVGRVTLQLEDDDGAPMLLISARTYTLKINDHFNR